MITLKYGRCQLSKKEQSLRAATHKALNKYNDLVQQYGKTKAQAFSIAMAMFKPTVERLERAIRFYNDERTIIDN